MLALACGRSRGRPRLEPITLEEKPQLMVALPRSCEHTRSYIEFTSREAVKVPNHSPSPRQNASPHGALPRPHRVAASTGCIAPKGEDNRGPDAPSMVHVGSAGLHGAQILIWPRHGGHCNADGLLKEIGPRECLLRQVCVWVLLIAARVLADHLAYGAL